MHASLRGSRLLPLLLGGPALAAACPRQAPVPPSCLVVCTNSNICGKRNPTNLFGFGFAFRAIECLRVLGPPGLGVSPGPCFIRCSRGVNAKLVMGGDGARMPGGEGRDGKPYFRLNSIDDMLGWLEAECGAESLPPATLEQAYRDYAAACAILGDRVNGPARGDLLEDLDTRDWSAADCSEALPPLAAAAEYVRSLPPPRGGWPPPPAARRRGFAGEWVESFYSSRLCLAPPGGAEAAAPPAAPASYGGGGAEEGEAALQATRLALRSPAEAEAGGGPEGGGAAGGGDAAAELEGEYRRGAGSMRGRAEGGSFAGVWHEAEAGGGAEVRLHLADRGLRFEGAALVAGAGAGEWVEWTGERVAPAGLAAGGSARGRWQARVCAMHARVLAKLGRGDEAAEAAAAAVRRCPTLPAAWDAAAECAAALGDYRAAAQSLDELFYLQPVGSTAVAAAGQQAPELPSWLSNARRSQRLLLDKIRRGELRSVTAEGARPLSRYLAGVLDPQASSRQEEDGGGEGGGRSQVAEAEGSPGRPDDPLSGEVLERIFAEQYGE